MTFLSKVLSSYNIVTEDSHVKIEAGAPEEKAIEQWLDAKGGDFGKNIQGKSKGSEFWSYKTIIAKIKGKTLYVNSTSYSNTTKKLTSKLKYLGADKGFTVVEKDEKFFGTSMEEKLPMGVR